MAGPKGISQGPSTKKCFPTENFYSAEPWTSFPKPRTDNLKVILSMPNPFLSGLGLFMFPHNVFLFMPNPF